MCQFLKTNDTQLVVVVLEGLANLLRKAQRLAQCPVVPAHPGNENYLDYVLLLLEECGGLDTIQELRCNHNDEIYGLANDIIDHYFNASQEVSITTDLEFKLLDLFFSKQYLISLFS